MAIGLVAGSTFGNSHRGDEEGSVKSSWFLVLCSWLIAVSLELQMFLGGQTITGMGWAGRHAVFVDFVSQYTTGFLWQLYANRKLVGTAESPRQRRIIGQVVPSPVPYPLTLVRVSSDDVLTDYGSVLPSQAWNRHRLSWTAPGLSANTDHFDVISGNAPGEAPDPDNVIARVPYYGDVPYSYQLSAISEAGDWQFGIVPRDNALPLGNAGDETDVTVTVVVMPADLSQDINRNRFSLSAAAGVLTAHFAY